MVTNGQHTSAYYQSHWTASMIKKFNLLPQLKLSTGAPLFGTVLEYIWKTMIAVTARKQKI